MSDAVLSVAKAGEVRVLHPRRYAALRAALDAAVAADPALVPGRSLILNPLALLEAMAADAPGALGDDVRAAERLRLLLAMTAAQVPPLSALRDVIRTGATAAPSAASFSADAPAAPCEDGVLHTGGLVVVALAAGRVGKPTGLAEPLIHNVLGLAVAAGPAEALSRSLAAGMTAAQVRALLSGLGAVAENGQDRRLSASIAAFLTDLCERARWTHLELLFAQVRDDVAATPWDAAGTGSLLDLAPRDACPGDPLTLRLEPPPAQPPPIVIEAVSAQAGEPVLDAAHFLPLLARGEAEVVFAAPGLSAAAVPADAVDPAAGTVTVRVPEGAHAGWVGFSDPALLRRSNAAREGLRAAWAERNAALASLRYAPVPVEAIPDLGTPPVPPRVPQARFDGGTPVFLEASLEPAVADPGQTLRLAWRAAGARTVSVGTWVDQAEAEGTLEVPAPADRSHVPFVLRAHGACGDPAERELAARVRVRIRGVEVTQSGRAPFFPLRIFGVSRTAFSVRGALTRLAPPTLVEGEDATVQAVLSAPDAPGTAVLRVGETTIAMAVDGGLATAALPGALVADGLSGTVVYHGPDGREEDRRDFGPLRFVPLRTRAVVVLRPAVVGQALLRAGADEVRAAVEHARSRLGMEVAVAEPAWVDDEDLSLARAADGEEVPATAALLERLAALAARCPGMEEHTWVAVVPAPATGREFFRVEPADAARAVAVCTPGALAALLEAEPPPAAARTPRLRVVGTLEDDGTVRLQPLRVETRGAGPGAPADTGLRAVGVDAAGRVVSSAPVRALSADRPARIVVLLPVTEHVAALELRPARGGAPVRRVARLAGEPSLPSVQGEDGAVEFEYAHTNAVRPHATLEAGSDARGWSPVLRLGPCQRQAAVAAGRLALLPGDVLRVVATDGWDTAAGPDGGLPLEPAARRVVARHAGEHVFWADAGPDEGGEAVWSFDGGEVRGAVAVVPAHYRGFVTLTVGGGEEGGAQDTRVIAPDGRVDDRSTLLPEEGRHA